MTEVLEALVGAGATAEQLVAAVRAEESARARALAAETERRRERAAARQRAKRARDAAAKAARSPKLTLVAGHAVSRPVTPVTRDTPVLPPEVSPRPPSSPTNLSPVPPIVPQIGGPDEVVCEAFEQAWRAYPHVAGRSSRPKAIAEWIRLSPQAQAAMAGAAARYRAEGREPRMDCGAKAFELWLRDCRYLDWMAAAAPAAAPVRATWPGPAALRAEAVAAAGESFVAAYLDPSGWRPGEGQGGEGEGGEVLARTGTAAERLLRELRALLARRGVSVRHERAAA